MFLLEQERKLIKTKGALYTKNNCHIEVVAMNGM